ncbi:MAG: chemotaxis protein [bacterium]|nr:chemotaxis protein [bacterium]
METNILLESGTNELEILEFCVGNQHYGINVAKVKEILPYQQPTAVPNSHPSIEGIFMPRNEIITVVSLFKSLNIINNGATGKEMMVVTNFNQLSIGFHVSSVLGIHRVSWKDITKPDVTLNNNGAGVATGIVKLGNKLIIILDFEKIVADVCPATSLKIDDVKNLGQRDRNSKPILIAEDSPMLEQLIKDCLLEAGYTNITITANGQEAWNLLERYKLSGSIENKVACVITDIEMPQMDGHRLTKLIKTDNALKEVPVVLFSSLVNEEMRAKGKLLGADAQISKPEIGILVQTIDQFLF